MPSRQKDWSKHRLAMLAALALLSVSAPATLPYAIALLSGQSTSALAER